MKIGFLTMEKQSNRPKNSVGSSRIRARWLYDRWEGAEEFQIGGKYDVLVYQKVYWDNMMDNFDGIQIMDLCDPDWLDGRDVFKYINKADACVTSTRSLADYIRKITDTPTVCIPDRVAISEHKPIHPKHTGKAKHCVWFGYSGNFKYVSNAIPHLVKKGISLTTIADKPVKIMDLENLNHDHVKYNYRKVHGIIGYADIALLPETKEYDFKGYFKSNNKTLTCWALGIPVVKVPGDLERFMDAGEREKERQKRLKEIETLWNVEYSVQEYKDLIGMIKADEPGLIEAKFDERLDEKGIK